MMTDSAKRLITRLSTSLFLSLARPAGDNSDVFSSPIESHSLIRNKELFIACVNTHTQREREGRGGWEVKALQLYYLIGSEIQNCAEID